MDRDGNGACRDRRSAQGPVMIATLLAQFWPLIVAAVGVLLGVFGLRQAGAERTKRRAAERRANTQKEMRDHEREASQMDDTSLADRITRRD